LIYIFAIWFYSHKLKKFLFIGNLTAAILAVIPFFAVFIYYQNFNNVIFVHATFLFLLIAMKELTKDLENIKGDLAQNYKTIPIVYGVIVSKTMLTALSIATLIPVVLLLLYFSIGYMNYYFYGSIIALVFFDIILWKSSKRNHFLTLHNILKLIIVIGVFSIVLIDVHLVLSRVI
jgi:4-hydroxybenzoate polyprenyltransferase